MGVMGVKKCSVFSLNLQTSIGRTLDSSPHSQRKKFSNSPDRLEQYHSPSASPKDYRGYHMTPDRSPDEPPRRRHMTPESNGDQRRHHLSRRSPRLSPTGRRRRRRSFSSSPPPRSRSLLASREAELDEAPPPKKKKEELDPILTRTGTFAMRYLKTMFVSRVLFKSCYFMSLRTVW